MKPVWREGNTIGLLENGEEFFPRVFEAIAQARTRVYIETFILLDDKVGLQLLEALSGAAARGVEVDVLADGFGSEPLGAEYRARLAEAGVRLHIYEPRRRLFGLRMNVFRRLHRKIVLIDSRVAFVGGINFCCDQLLESGPRALQDYAVELTGPIVHDIEDFVVRSYSAAHLVLSHREALMRRVAAASDGSARVRFVTRDNHRHPTDIEREYRIAIRA
ncbi:MAG TPA: cardiolipin synthase ClsB, partial [Tahibacter sp.]|uniref:cardiolipin synthase ClsB n=1 Tax=Tahibacter sp. TaxID=2056211 RepID=UPI002C3BC3CC